VLERKLTATLCADVFGYSRLMGDDQQATLRTLSSHRKLIDSLIEQHRGRFVNSAGDKSLAEPGRICISCTVCEHLGNKLALATRTSARSRSRTSPNRKSIPSAARCRRAI